MNFDECLNQQKSKNEIDNSANLKPEGHPPEGPLPWIPLELPGCQPGQGRAGKGLPFDNDNDNNVATKRKFRQKTSTNNGVEPNENGISNNIKRT